MSNIKKNTNYLGQGGGFGDYLAIEDVEFTEVVKGAKRGQEQPRKPVIAKDSAASTSFVKVQYGISEGEILGLVDGAKSIRLNGTPLVDNDGNKNFPNVVYDFRAGTNEQAYMQGFPDISNETGIGVELRSEAPWVQSFTNNQLSAIRLRLKWNALSKTNLDNGDVSGYEIKYAVDLKTGSGAYVEVINTKIADKTSAGYSRTHRINLPRSTSGWQLRVRRLTPNSTSDLIQDKMFIDAVAEVIDVKMRYPNTALIGLEYDAETFGNIAKLEADLYGKIVRVPTNYNPKTREYTGIWNGEFKEAYTDNPAWIYYDLVVEWRYGLGERIKQYMIDKWTLYNLGRYCDEMVSDGRGGQEPRFTCNIYLQKQVDAYQVLSNIAGIFRAMSYWNGEQIILDADVPQDPAYTFSRANVIDGVFEYTGTRQRDRHTIVKVAWDNPENGYKTEYEYVRDEKAIAKFGVKVLDLSAFGCTSQSQAQRAGLWALKTEQLETRQVAFGAGLDGFIPQVGNIINISDEMLSGRANGGRISTVSDTKRILELDRPVDGAIGSVLVVNGANGKTERRNISNVVGNRVTVTAAFTDAESQNVWAIESPDLALMRFRVMSIKRNDDATFEVVAIQHEPQKYNAIDYGVDIEPTQITTVQTPTIKPPAAVNIKSRYRVEQSQTIATMIISWSQVEGAVAYEVEWRKDDNTWVKMPRTGGVSVEVDGVYKGGYMARVRAVTALDFVSAPTTSALTQIKGKQAIPPVLSGLVVQGVLFGMKLSWGFGAGSTDAAYTEVQVGSAPNVNVATLGQFSYPTNKHEITGMQGNLSQSYRARLVDKFGTASAWSEWATGTTTESVSEIMDIITGHINESSLTDDLREKIDISGTITTDISGVKADIAAANAAIDKAKQDIVDANLALDDTNLALDDTNLALDNAKTDITEAKRIADLAKADSATNKIDLIAVNKTVGENKTAVDSQITTLTNKDISLTNLYTALKSEYDGNKATVAQELTALANEDISLSNLLTALDSDYKGNKTAIRQELTAVSTKTDSTASSLSLLTTEVGKNKTAISTEATTRSNEDSALSKRITTVSGQTDNALARIATAETTIANNTGAITQQKTDITAEYKQAIDDIEIGGRNLLLNSNFKKPNVLNGFSALYSTHKWENNSYVRTVTSVSSASRLEKIFTLNDIGIFTYSMNIKSSVSGEWRSPVGVSILNSTSHTVGDDFSITTVTFMNTSKGSKTLRYYTPNAPIGNIQIIDWEKLEKGNKATDWTPAPEDVEADYNAKISTESTARADADKTITSSITTLKSDYDANKASVTSSLSTLTTKDTALTNSLNALTTRVGTAESTIISNNTALVNKDTALTNSLNALTTDYNGNKTAIRNELTAVSNKTNSTATSLGTLTTTVGNNTTKISQESTARSTADTALGKRITDTDAIAKNAQSRVGTAETAISTANSAIATLRTDLTASYSVKDTRSTNETPAWYITNYPRQVVREFKSSSAIGISGGGYTYLETTVKYGDASGGNVTQEATSNTGIVYVRRGAGTTWQAWVQQEDTTGSAAKVAALKTALDKDIKATDARVTAEKKVAADATSAVAKTVGTLTTTVNGHTASIQTQQSSINGLNAKYTVRVDAGGRVSGFGLASSTTRSDFAVVADNFYISSPTGSAKGVKPFSVVGNTTYIKNVVIDYALISNVKVKTAQIENAAVDTLQIKGDAVTIPRVQYFNTPFQLNKIQNINSHQFGNISMDAKGGSVTIQVIFDYVNMLKSGSGSSVCVFSVAIMRGTTQLQKFSRTAKWTNSAFDEATGVAYPTVVDTNPPAGSHVYSVIASYTIDGVYVSLTMGARSIHVLGAKR